MPEQLVLPDALAVGHGRDDMPVPVRGVTGDHRERAATLEMHLAGTDCVDGRAVRSRDVDPEVKRPRRPSDTRIVEHAAHRMRPIERFQRPAVQISKRTPTGDSLCLEPASSR